MLKAVLLLLTFFFSDSQEQCFGVSDAVAYLGPEHVNSWVASRTNFSVSLFKVLDKERNQNNVIFSPTSIHEVLTLAYFGSERETEVSLSKVLQLSKDQNKALVWRIYNNQRLINVGRESKNYPLKSAQRLFLSSKLRLRSCMRQKFQRQVEMKDFQNHVDRVQTRINQWVEKQTEGKIKNYLQGLSNKTTATIISTVYFKGKWLNEFNSDETQYIPFRVSTYEVRRISMMVKKNIFEAARHPQLGARMVLLPYEGNKTAMIVLLPDKDLDSMIESMNGKTLEFVFNRRNFVPTELKIYIPKFEHRQKMELEKIMEPLGIGNTFTQFTDFSGFTGRKEVFVQKLTHDAVIQVDEEGGNSREVSAVTSYYSGQRPFMCDRPFAYIIYDFMTRKIIFMGTFRDPQQAIDR